MLLEIGKSVQIPTEVTEALSAETLGNPGVNVLATPCLAALCDDAAAKACSEISTRRMRVDIRHVAATSIGDTVRITAKIIAVTETLVVCRIDGKDSMREIVNGHVSRSFA
ncbi:MAG: hypothetical protein CFH41_00145 [Alphaproteobacteria bacterium MarineAlpha11_Bin1]|nr:MAG: hypothetical protein CFH41_00145 [Alphaproteobacteria bacterium MarineAlpha11_Bin1]|tara:strand:+ start:1689 stop:2021 length:333 start_codon:yes stop_codon:yes gene_type:complete